MLSGKNIFDIDSEIKLYDALPDIALGRTVIIVSNRLYHLRLCNKIFVLEDGKIKQEGSFESLKQLPGFFSETFYKQTSIPGLSQQKKSIKINLTLSLIQNHFLHQVAINIY